MINFVQPANVVEVTAPRALKSGDGVVVGKLFGIATVDAANGAKAQVMIEGAVELIKTGGVVPTEGGAINFDETTQRIVATGGKLIGYCIEVSSPDNASASWVKLIPTPV
jgi:predicted RecA/RadA family phage recombinase